MDEFQPFRAALAAIMRDWRAKEQADFERNWPDLAKDYELVERRYVGPDPRTGVDAFELLIRRRNPPATRSAPSPRGSLSWSDL